MSLIKELKEQVEMLTERLYEEQEKREFSEKLIVILFIIDLFIFLVVFSPRISVWYHNLNEYQKGVVDGLFGLIIFLAFVVFVVLASTNDGYEHKKAVGDSDV
jgi:energy-coupling factor transporter transmembrane protein EcfT